MKRSLAPSCEYTPCNTDCMYWDECVGKKYNPTSHPGKSTVYMAVTADQYELPIALGNLAKELAISLGVPYMSMLSCIARGDSGKHRGFKFVKVRVE